MHKLVFTEFYCLYKPRNFAGNRRNVLFDLRIVGRYIFSRKKIEA